MAQARRTGAAATLLLCAGMSAAGCGPYLHAVDDGVYGARVPTAEQWADERADQIPGGFAALTADGADRVVARIEGDRVTFEVDGESVATRTVRERRDITDREGSGPLRAETQALLLGGEPLVLGSLSISDPAIWYAGGYEATSVIALKPWDLEERGPIEQCSAADEQCLLLPVGEALVGDPVGEYDGIPDPSGAANPVSGIRVSATEIVYTLATGMEVRSSRESETLVRACALSETAVWQVPGEVEVGFDDPVLAETHCALPSGDFPRLTLMERSDLPLLAPLAPRWGGDWCQPGPECLWFLDEEGGES